MTPTTDTPRTDDFCTELPSTDFDSENWRQVIAIADFSRQLERELAASKAEVERLTKKLSITEDELADVREWLDERYKATSELDERAEKAEADVERLRGLLEEAIPTLRRFHYANLSIHLRQCLNNIDSEKATLKPDKK